MAVFPGLPAHTAALFGLLLSVAVARASPSDDGSSRDLSRIGRGVFQASPPPPIAAITGGFSSSPGEFPYFASLRRFDRHVCGGVLISPNLVLTAAHCMVASPDMLTQPQAVRVGLFGVNDGPTESDAFEEFQVCRVIVHEEFDIRDLLKGFDIALLVLDRPSKAASLAQLPRGDDAVPGDSTVVMGFGKISNGAVASTLQKTEILTVISNEECTEKWQTVDSSIEIRGSLLCVFAANGTDVCQGDSGGPVMDAAAATVLGAVSFGPPDCVLAAVPGVFTRVSAYLDWIDALGAGASLVQDSDACSADPVLPPGGGGGVTAGQIFDAIKSGNEVVAAGLIKQAVEEGGTEAVVEAMRLAAAAGEKTRRHAGGALFAAVRAGISVLDLQEAFRALRSGK